MCCTNFFSSFVFLNYCEVSGLHLSCPETTNSFGIIAIALLLLQLFFIEVTW